MKTMIKTSLALCSLLLVQPANADVSNPQIGNLLFEDNFNSLNSNNWTPNEGDGCAIGLCGWGNQELQWYSSNNLSIEDVPGEPGNKALVFQARNDNIGGRAFSSGKIDSQHKLAVQYGMIEVRMRVPDLATGLWPAAWMLGTSTASWPAKGEIDMMEMGHRAQARADSGHAGANINSYVGANAIFYADAACVPENPSCAAMTAWQTDNAYVAAQPLSNRFVIYRTYWTDSQLRFTVIDNGVEYDMYDAPINITEESSELQQPFYLLANLAVGGNFTDAATNTQVTAPLPGKMYLDYIRVYQLNGQGQVFSGNINPPETGSFGVFTDSAAVSSGLQAGVSSDIFIWNQSSVVAGNTAPAEGNNVIAWHYVAPNQWFGGGVHARQLRDMSNFADGTVSFRIKIPADVSFRIGIADDYTNQNWITFPANESKYGLVRNGDWGQVTIPVADLRGSLIALQALSGMFYISSVDGQLPGYSFQFAIDDIVWHGGGNSNQQADSDGDGVPDSADQCSNTAPGSAVDANGCPTASGAFGVAQTSADSVRFFVNSSGWADVHYTVNSGGQINVGMQQASGVNQYAVSGLPAGAVLNYFFTYWDTANGYAVDTPWQSYTLGSGVNPQPDPEPEPEPGQDSDGDGVEDAQDNCPGTPPGTPVNANGCPLTSIDVVPLYNASTVLEPAIQFDRGDALVTRFSDRARDRHAKENHFQAYDHYLTFYWEDRTAAIEIVDYVAKGGSSIRMNVVTQNKLDDLQAENRWWYIGVNTLAEFCGNGVMNMIDYTHYWKEESYNCREGRPIQVGDKLEFEISQFLDAATLPRGRSNYYGTTFLYIVGQGIVPWDVTDKQVFQPGNYLQRDSIPVPATARLGGDTTLHVQMTAEPDGHFQQMATNLGYDNGQPFVLGRRVHHSSAVDGSHDEHAENGIFTDMAGLSGSHYINDRCAGCHVRNGRAAVAAIGESLDKWVFKVADAAGNPHPQLGRVLQSKTNGGAGSEGNVSIASFTENNGLRKPNYQFSGVVPQLFSARIAPQLNGMGLLEAIPEAAILALEDENDSNGDGISGRAQRVVDPQSGDTRLGRFGYKAAAATVKHQVAAALNTDMGVMTAMFSSPDCGSNQSGCASSGRQLSEQHLDNLVKYVSLLGVRPQRDYNDAQVMQGKNVFRNIGCDGCHTESHQTSAYHPLSELRNQTIYPYTDLLLHDMGPGLADNLGEGNASGAEWRTAPLWGLGLSACVTGGVAGGHGWDAFGLDGYEYCTPQHSYLHDGRARTIDEAIRWHGGEGQASNDNYQALPDNERSALLAFLNSL